MTKLQNKSVITSKDKLVFKGPGETYEFKVVNGRIIKDGKYRANIAGSNRRIKANYNNGRLDGKYIIKAGAFIDEIHTYSNGVLLTARYYDDAYDRWIDVDCNAYNKHIPKYSYDNSGILKAQLDFTDNKPNGLYITYYNTGRVRKVVHYKDGEEIAQFTY